MGVPSVALRLTVPAAPDSGHGIAARRRDVARHLDVAANERDRAASPAHARRVPPTVVMAAVVNAPVAVRLTAPPAALVRRSC